MLLQIVFKNIFADPLVFLKKNEKDHIHTQGNENQKRLLLFQHSINKDYEFYQNFGIAVPKSSLGLGKIFPTVNNRMSQHYL